MDSHLNSITITYQPYRSSNELMTAIIKNCYSVYSLIWWINLRNYKFRLILSKKRGKISSLKVQDTQVN